jgi:hypothetical protein
MRRPRSWGDGFVGLYDATHARGSRTVMIAWSPFDFLATRRGLGELTAKWWDLR